MAALTSPSRVRRTAVVAVGVLAVVSAFAMAGTSDLADEQAAEHHYCEMVMAGYWPAYDPAIECPAGPHRSYTDRVR